MDKKQIIKIIKKNSKLNYDDLKKQALEAGISEDIFDEVWSKLKARKKKIITFIILFALLIIGLIWLFSINSSIPSISSDDWKESYAKNYITDEKYISPEPLLTEIINPNNATQDTSKDSSVGHGTFFDFNLVGGYKPTDFFEGVCKISDVRPVKFNLKDNTEYTAYSISFNFIRDASKKYNGHKFKVYDLSLDYKFLFSSPRHFFSHYFSNLFSKVTMMKKNAVAQIKDNNKEYSLFKKDYYADEALINEYTIEKGQEFDCALKMDRGISVYLAPSFVGFEFKTLSYGQNEALYIKNSCLLRLINRETKEMLDKEIADCTPLDGY